MAISINPMTYVIYVPQADLTHISGVYYELDLNDFRQWLKDLEDDPDYGMWMPKTHDHNTEVTLSGITYARIIEILDPYTVEFEDGQYVVNCTGANHNLADVKVPNQVSLIVNNAAGLIVYASGSGVTQQDKLDIADEVWGHSDGDFLLKVVRNKKTLEKTGSVWELIIYDDDNSTPMLTKALKDKDGNNITDLAAGTLAQELKTSV